MQSLECVCYFFFFPGWGQTKKKSFTACQKNFISQYASVGTDIARLANSNASSPFLQRQSELASLWLPLLEKGFPLLLFNIIIILILPSVLSPVNSSLLV